MEGEAIAMEGEAIAMEGESIAMEGEGIAMEGEALTESGLSFTQVDLLFGTPPASAYNSLCCWGGALVHCPSLPMFPTPKEGVKTVLPGVDPLRHHCYATACSSWGNMTQVIGKL